MKSEAELQRAHDLLVGLITDPQLNKKMSREVDAMVRASADVLCWALDHSHNRNFAKNLAELEAALAQLGYFLNKGGRG